jgi:hypothetical protein
VTVLDASEDPGLEVISSTPGVPGEVVVLELAARGTLVSLVVCVTETRPVVVEGTVFHSMRMLMLDESRHPEPGAGNLWAGRLATRAEVLSASEVVGVIARETDAQVLNVSGSGCLMETATPVECGTTPVLTLLAGEEEFSDAVRVTRCDRIEGAGSRYLVGGEFLWTTSPGPGSLRRAARSLRAASGPAKAQSVQPPLVM